jgi:hypothetical protein
VELTREHRRQIKANAPLTTAEPPELDQWVQIEDGFDLQVTKVEEADGEFTVHYRLRDLRAERLLRATLPRHGFDDAEPTAASIERAAQESAYTSSTFRSIEDAGEAVPEDDQRRFTAAARARYAEQRKRDQIRDQIRGVSHRLREIASQDADEATAALGQIHQLLERR